MLAWDRERAMIGSLHAQRRRSHATAWLISDVPARADYLPRVAPSFEI